MSSCNSCNTGGQTYTTQPYNYGLSPAAQTNGAGCPVSTAPKTMTVSVCPPQSSQYYAYETCGVNTATYDKPWIDTYLRNNFLFGHRVIDQESGFTDLSLIPQYLMSWCPAQTAPNSPGIKVGDCFTLNGKDGQWQRYIRIVGTNAYMYIRNLHTGEELSEGSWNFGIPNCAIIDLDASKLTNVCDIFVKTAEPVSNYFDQSTGILPSNYRTLPIVYSDSTNCKLLALLKCQDVRACVIPSLVTPKGPLWSYDPIADTQPILQPQNLDCLVNVCIDGQTVRAANPGGTGIPGQTKGGAGETDGGTILTAYTYVNDKYLTGDGTLANPIDIKENSLDGEVIKKCDNINPGFVTLDDFIYMFSWSFYDGQTRWSQGGSIGGVYNVDYTGSDEISIVDFDGGGAPTPSIVGFRNISIRTPEIPCDGKKWVARINLLYRQSGSAETDSDFNNVRAGIDSITNGTIFPDNSKKVTLYANFVDDDGLMDSAGLSGGGSTLALLDGDTNVNMRIFNQRIYPNNSSNPANNRQLLGFVTVSINILGMHDAL